MSLLYTDTQSEEITKPDNILTEGCNAGVGVCLGILQPLMECYVCILVRC